MGFDRCYIKTSGERAIEQSSDDLQGTICRSISSMKQTIALTKERKNLYRELRADGVSRREARYLIEEYVSPKTAD